MVDIGRFPDQVRIGRLQHNAGVSGLNREGLESMLLLINIGTLRLFSVDLVNTSIK